MPVRRGQRGRDLAADPRDVIRSKRARSANAPVEIFPVNQLHDDGAVRAILMRLYRRADRRSAALLFHYSLLYLALLFAAMAVDKIVL